MTVGRRDLLAAGLALPFASAAAHAGWTIAAQGDQAVNAEGFVFV